MKRLILGMFFFAGLVQIGLCGQTEKKRPTLRNGQVCEVTYLQNTGMRLSDNYALYTVAVPDCTPGRRVVLYRVMEIRKDWPGRGDMGALKVGQRVRFYTTMGSHVAEPKGIGMMNFVEPDQKLHKIGPFQLQIIAKDMVISPN